MPFSCENQFSFNHSQICPKSKMRRKKSPRITFTDREREILNDDDRISRLPDDVIHYIFSFIDTRFAIRSSALSSRWRNTWKTQSNLNFKFERPIDHPNPFKFPNFIHRFLSDRDHNAELTTIEFKSNSIRLSLLKEIIIYAMSHRTQNLNIEFSGEKQTRRGGFDASLFRSRFLQDLHLIIDFELLITPNITWDLPNLTSLNLEDVTFTLYPTSDSKSIELFSRFPNLKTLTLVSCRLTNIDTFIITSSGLINLTLINLNHSSKFVIATPKLSSFTYYGMARFSLSAMDLDSLETVNFHTRHHKFLEKKPEIVETMVKTFKQLQKAKFLSINSDVVRFLSEFPELLKRRCPFMNVKILTLVENRLPPSSNFYSGVIAYFKSTSPDVIYNVIISVAPWKIRYIDSS